MTRPALLAPGAKRYLTEAGAERLREEIVRLRSVAPASGAGESELETKREQRLRDERVRHLQHVLSVAEIIPSSAADHDVVRVGAIVTVKEEDGANSTYRIVGVDETEFFEDGISFVSPLAQALLRARVGDQVRFQSPSGPRQLEILRIE